MVHWQCVHSDLCITVFPYCAVGNQREGGACVPTHYVHLLCCAVLCCVVLCCAVLCCAVLCCAVLYCAALHYIPSILHNNHSIIYIEHIPYATAQLTCTTDLPLPSPTPTPTPTHHTPYTTHRTPHTVHHTPYTTHRTPHTSECGSQAAQCTVTGQGRSHRLKQ